MDRTLDPASLLSLGASYTAPSLGGLDVTPTVTPRTAHSPSRVTPSLGSCAVCASCASRCTAFAPVSLPRPFDFAHTARTMNCSHLMGLLSISYASH